ncbi:MAG: HigA family addiction module antitoxin [Anaerolineaceae bacterium]|jgi:addiction module HigA family antidote
MQSRDFGPLHPGEVLLSEFLIPLKMSQSELAIMSGLSEQKIEDLISEKGKVSPEIALKLALALGTTPEFWLTLQQDYDTECGLMF